MSLSDHKDTIQRLYVDEDLTLDELMGSMERDFGIHVSKDTYKRHFKKWELRKNNNRDFYVWANHRIEKRSHVNPKKKTQIRLNGKAIDEKTIQKNIPRQVSSYDQARAAAASPATPQGYSIVTPAGSTPRQPQDTSARPGETPSSSQNASLESDITDQEDLTEIKLLAEVMQDCGSFLSLWGQMDVSTSRKNLGQLYTSVAERIITDTWDLQSHPRHTPRLLSVLGFDTLHSSYKDDFERVQLQLQNLPQDIYADTVRAAMFIASAKGCVSAAAALFGNQLKVDSRDSKGHTCLGIAVLHNHPTMVSFLIARGANVNNRRRDGQTVWTQICTSEEHETVSQILINAGADVNTLVNSVNDLYISAAGGHIDDVRRLIRRGMNPSIQTSCLWAPLHWAASIVVVKALVEAGADVNTLSDTSKTPLATIGKYPGEIRDYLIEHGAVLNPRRTTKSRKKSPSSMPSSSTTSRSNEEQTKPTRMGAGLPQSLDSTAFVHPSHPSPIIASSPASSSPSLPLRHSEPALSMWVADGAPYLASPRVNMDSPSITSRPQISIPGVDDNLLLNEPPMPSPRW